MKHEGADRSGYRGGRTGSDSRCTDPGRCRVEIDAKVAAGYFYDYTPPGAEELALAKR
ncbi:hypothetical protein ACU4GD_00690 [Cupriavidus basilensis]